MKILKPLIALLCLISLCNIASAAEIIIEDTSGVVRHVADIDYSALIKFTVNDTEGLPLDGAIINLTPKVGGESRQGVSVDGVVEFMDVAPGHWVVSTESPKLLFTQIDVGEFGSAVASMGDEAALANAAAGTGMSTGAIVGTTIISAASITGIAVGVNESQDNKKTPMSPFE